MREKPSGCHARTGHVRGTTDMCSRDPPVLHPALAKANGKNSSPQLSNHHHHHQEVVRCVDADNVLSPHATVAGGRLKFFKDGKFILELSHRRDGERTTWFSVPKKTFWPPASSIPSRQESSTSLSVSDDNSSIQSSPWQRDHCWKQANPKRSLSKEYDFFFYRNPKQRQRANPRFLARKWRQTLDSNPVLPSPEQRVATGTAPKPPCRRSNGVPIGKTLSLIIDKLSRLDPTVVSPRKRILRELERVTLEDQASKRRATPQPVTTGGAPSPSQKQQLSSYSITSILGEDKPSGEPGFLRNLLKPEDKQPVKYSSNHSSYPRARVEPYVGGANNVAMHHPLYGLQMLPPGPYRAPLWMHYSTPIHYPAPLPLYAPPPPHPSTSPIHHYKDYREQTLTPPSDMPLNLSKHAG